MTAKDDAHKAEVARVRAEWNADAKAAASKLNAVEKQHAKAVAQANADHAAALHAMTAKHTAEVKSIRALHQKELMSAADDIDAAEARLEAEIKKLREQLVAAKQERDAALKDAANEHAAAVAVLEKK